MNCCHCGYKNKKKYLEEHLFICSNCGGLFRMPPRCRIEALADEGSVKLFFCRKKKLRDDPLQFLGYAKKLKEAREKSGLSESVLTARCKIGNVPVIISVMDFSFIGGTISYGCAVEILSAIDLAIKKRTPFIFVASSGGARIQEGVHSLKAMSLVSAGISRLRKKGLAYISLLADPVSGGMTASLASLGDFIFSEPGAFVGFAGPRVLRNRGVELMPNDQRAEEQFKRGFIDKIVERKNLRSELVSFVPMVGVSSIGVGSSVNRAIQFCKKEMAFNNIQVKKGMAAVRRARDYHRIDGLSLIEFIFDDFILLSGDRIMGDDSALIGAIASVENKSCLVLATNKGRTSKELMENRYAMVSALGFRKALRLIKIANRLGLPILSFIDTPGADASLESERNGIGQSIAELLAYNSGIKVPFLTIIIGQGGSGGAFALTNGRDILMQEGSILSVIMPEGGSSILFKDTIRIKDAAEFLGLDPQTLFDQELIQGIIPENKENSNQILKETVLSFLGLKLKKKNTGART